MTYDALIVGFGPVGATMANLLARRGLHVGVVEAEREIYDKPRAITHDHEVMRIYQACGLADRIAAFTAPHPGTHYLGVDGRVIKKVESLPPPYPLAWPPTGTFVQRRSKDCCARVSPAVRPWMYSLATVVSTSRRTIMAWR